MRDVYHGTDKVSDDQEASSSTKYDKLYTFDEAIDATGNGIYNISLAAVMSMSFLAMGCDMFGFSVVVSGATCDFHLGIEQTSMLLSMSFIGPIVMSYPWGYVSDTWGRKKSLLLSLWGGFLASSISAFSSNWIMLATLKFVSTSFVSCVQSAIFTLIGESCPPRMRDCYMLAVTSIFKCVLALYIGIAYCILNRNFSYYMGSITFTPWRLLVLVLASMLGASAIGVHFLYESPKFLLNAGRGDEALIILRKIYERNGGTPGGYLVKQVCLDESGNPGSKDKSKSLCLSLWRQLVPLFKPPLLWRSLQVYFLSFIIYGTNNSYLVWFPYLSQKFVDGMSSSDQVSGLCNMFVRNSDNRTDNMQCSTKVEISLFWSTLTMGLLFSIILCGIASIAHRKRTIMIIILLLSGICGVISVLIPHNVISLLLFFGTTANGLVIGMIYSFIVDLYPTSFRGMAACLCTMVARLGALSGINFIGTFMMSNCTATFSVCSVLMMAGVLVTSLLPPDKPRI